MNHFAIAIGVFSCGLVCAHGQGLLDIGSRMEDGVRLPFQFTLSSSLGWDSEPGASSSTFDGGGVAESGSGSGYWQNSFSLHYPFGNERNRFTLSGDYSNMWYFDPPPGTQEFQNSGSFNLSYLRQINSRFSISDSFHVTYGTEPDFQIGESINRPTSGHFYGSNSLRVNYGWITRFHTVTSYSLDTILYDEESLQSEENTDHTFSQQFRYSLTQKTTATMDYRFSLSEYENNPFAESKSHFVLLGVDRPLGRFLSMNLSGGVEFRSYDNGPLGSQTEPYFEGAIQYLAREHTTFRLQHRSGLEDTGSAGLQSNYTQRTGVTMTHQFSRGLSLNVGLDYVNSEYSRNRVGVGNRDEDTLHASAGLHYSRQLWHRIHFNTGYTFSMVSSDDEFAEYDRHQLSLGLSATF